MLKANLKAAESVEQQANWLKDYRPSIRIKEQGKVISIGDGITWISGLPTAAIDDILVFEDGSRAMVFDLTESQVGAVLLHQTDQLTAGITAYPTGKLLSVPVSDSAAFYTHATDHQLPTNDSVPQPCR